ncbi:hypothetical protein ND486_28300 [Pseudonocardia sp. DR1-2]|uniref:hypothetical protein n=1 Tax=Pseudonocardia sp. DR1-2 TaxID=2951168 RepID=UPI002042E391|nr:hypothetical protein [Pseudonocardia sp. DR1-2]MCM3850100.1 hypothetical protein [Pseudonocardia sp. DR1-2]
MHRISAVVAVVLLSVAAALIPARSASAQEIGEPDFGTHPGWYRADSAIYDESVDGWWCHFTDQCRTEERSREDPPPIAAPTRGQQVEVLCEFGAYYLVDTPDGLRGWTPKRDVDSPWKQWPCGALDWLWKL